MGNKRNANSFCLVKNSLITSHLANDDSDYCTLWDDSQGFDDILFNVENTVSILKRGPRITERTNKELEIRLEILTRLNQIQEKENVKIIFACESGSRIAGFEFVNSDYDVRFIYIRPMNDYLSLFNHEDHINPPIIGEIDLVGWDLKKALKLSLKSNGTLMTWLCSSTIYYSSQQAVWLMQQIKKTYNARNLLQHYRGLAYNTYKREINILSFVLKKKYFYALYNTMKALYLDRIQDILVPNKYKELLNLVVKDQEVKKAMFEFLESRRSGTELELVSRIPMFDSFMEESFDVLPKPSGFLEPVEQSKKSAQKLFLDVILNQ